ncbi:resistance-nodulation-cell division (RND) efflux membrane fusion protein [Desulfosarcina ovata subsp. sediminis]|uniref:Resistance-nodulation-cell division (RND) efflux membrane fusion protein n=1 Tax=Desulfosarcina ovata subsp. sediminis TaxID=885957 RepID=A0A5K7ZQ13_9BACT|nr:efflux RND transporter periplasmic adaptor subunit [Desulfosarcina ovata]BBO82099.1 resistance-nodulation-cell division (RND) efflux membrane fusion protein [Desulfosarcina ovata subsp. sediminis]
MMKTYVVAGVCLFVSIWLSGCGTPEKNPGAETIPRSVSVQTIASRDLPIMVNAVGRLIPNREVILSAEVSGILLRYHADVGAKVARGALLAKLDPTDYALALKEAEANLLSARIQLPVKQNAFARARRLLPEKVITPELYDQAEAGFKSAGALVTQLETLVAQARRRLEKTAITTPFGGHVTQRFVETGQRVAIGDPVMQVADMQTMRVKISINELDYVHVDANDPVRVTVEAFAGRSLPGRVDKIGIQADARTNTFEIEILVDNPDLLLKAGLTARVAIETDVIPDAVMIGQDNVLFREDRKEVFIVDANLTAVAREVKLGRMDGSDVRILEGLADGDRLVIAGAQYLKPGDTVRVAP